MENICTKTEIICCIYCHDQKVLVKDFKDCFNCFALIKIPPPELETPAGIKTDKDQDNRGEKGTILDPTSK